MIEQKIMEIMDTIEYGFKDEFGNNIIYDTKKWDDEFFDFYYLLSPKELLEKKCGVCWDQVELERKLFEDNGIKVKTYFICTYDNDNLPSHTILTYEKDNAYCWFEHSWNTYKGIHKYNSEIELLKDVKEKFLNSHIVSDNAYTFVYEYQKPPEHIGCMEYYEYCETQKLIKLNEPLYFYHVINKDADLSKGILSLKYMYDNKLFKLFDKNIEKYKTRITDDWNIEKYNNRDKETLTREEIIDALNIFRGENGTSYIYFFKFPLYKELGRKIDELLKVKDIYRININDEEVQRNIKDIFYGYDESNSDNKVLNKKYYENVTKEEYFKKYDDSITMNFSKLNHISIAFKNDYCPIEFLKKV